MSFQVLMAQPASTSTQLLLDLFKEQGLSIEHAATPAEAFSLTRQMQPELVVVDLHSTDQGWSNWLGQLRQQFPQTKILFTTPYPDPQQELKATEHYGAQVFLRPPFTHTELAQALHRLRHPEEEPPAPASPAPVRLPPVRFPVRTKITLPYVLLALVLAAAAAFVVSRIVLDTIEERFTNQLIEAGKLTNDWMVKEEDRLLETLRLLTHTQGMAEAVMAGDAENLRRLVLPLAINYQEEAIEILDNHGNSVLSLHHKKGGKLEDYSASRGETIFNRWNFVQSVLSRDIDQGRDKFAGLAQTPWGDYFYMAGPLLADEGTLVGVALVGKSLPTLVQQVRQDTLAHTTLYDLNGHPLTSTLLDEETLPLGPETVSSILAQQDKNSLRRPLSIGSIEYSELIGPWEVRKISDSTGTGTGNNLGLIGVAQAETFLAQPGQITRLQIFLLTTVTFLLVIALGVYVANRITRPLMRVVEASAKVAQGNLAVQVEASGNDEVTVLTHSFNQMVSGLREGSAYRDLLGRTVSPEVREELRRGFASGEVRLHGQECSATVLISDIRGFTRLSETAEPATILTWLNEYFGEIVPLITAHGGVVNQIEGDTMMAFFGILPRPLPPQQSAYQACQAALKMLAVIEQLNARRVAHYAPPFTVGISINTGPVTAGGLGSNDRLQYTIIGDTVNTTARLESLTRQFGEESSALISQHTLFALAKHRHEFTLQPLGVHAFRGKVEQLLVYQLQPAQPKAKEQAG